MPRVQGHGIGPWKHHVANASTVTGTAAFDPVPEGADTLLLDTTAGNISQDLPPAAENVGRTLTFVNAGGGGNTLDVVAAGGDSLNDLGGAAAAMADGASVTVQAITSSIWQVVGSG